MYNTDDLVGNVVTIRAAGGDEYIAKLVGVDDDHKYLTLSYPKVVIINEGQVALIPFALTGDSSEVIMSTTGLSAVLPTLPETAKDYSSLVEDEFVTVNKERITEVEAVEG